MTANGYFRVRKNVIHQTLDQETVIINLDNGRYYSLNPMGSAIWDWLASAYSLDDIGARFETHAPAERDAIRQDLRDFVQTLEREELVAPAEVSNPPVSPTADASASPLPFTKPLLEIFTDLENLLPLDPIHEVDERGWPYRQPGVE